MPENWSVTKAPNFGAVKVDPYLLWAVKTEGRFLLRHQTAKGPFSVILGLNVTAAAFAEGSTPGGPFFVEGLKVPRTYATSPAYLQRATYCTATVTLEFLRKLAEDSVSGRALAAAVRCVELCVSPPADDLPDASADVVSPAGGPGTVVTGIIDDGIAYAHERFRNADGTTRIEYVWNQDDDQHLTKNDRADGVPGIDTRIANSRFAGLADEDVIYRGSHLVDYARPGHKPAAWRIAHGTHVMDLACGSDPADAPRNRPIVCVQLPMATTWDTSGATLADNVLKGLRYILERADELGGGKPPPVVVNLSYGLIAGPHDGSSVFEQSIDEIIALREPVAPLRMVMPAGNYFLARCHARFDIPNRDDDRTLHWRIQPDDRTPSYLEIWLPRAASGGAQPKVRLSIAAPDGTATTQEITEGTVGELRIGGALACQVTYAAPGSDTALRPMVLVALAPTASHDPATPLAPAGTWQIVVANDIGAGGTMPGPVEAWIRRDDTPYGYPHRGRQSYFLDECYERFDEFGRLVEVDQDDSCVKRAGTLNALATGRGKGVITIGGFERRARRVARYSSAGPGISPPGGTLPVVDDPDAVAVSEDSRVLHGVLAAGSRSGSVVAMNGTSVAAPRVARWIAEELGANPRRPGDCDAVQAHAQAEDPPRPTNPPAGRLGGGRLGRLGPQRHIPRDGS